jgi:hypothetical protein
MDRRSVEQAQREETIAAGQDAVTEEPTNDEAHKAHKKEGTQAAHAHTGEHQEVGREGGRTDHIVLDSGEAVPRHPHG